uniref:TfuA-like core domain-containing protein n=1 Tax=Streptomyces olivoviridis TaxID=67338 RepID=T2HVP5_9ACTN|nr:TfuA-like core domain-containing protein [Streptomyces olivoviridis]BBI93409.1 TfuA-like protein [Streptomyces olivoviridis]
MRTVIFVGPSVERDVLERILPDADFRPPIERGDIDTLLAEPVTPDAIGVVDGKFLHAMSISPKEILKALARDVRVFGSSSMGALRAAELDLYGMTGVGKIYASYASGALDADDEVAITFDPETLRALCVPMVNIRTSVEELEESGRITAAEASDVLNTAKGMYFPERSHSNIRLALQRDGWSQERATEVQRLLDGSTDQKRADAIELAQRLRDLAAAS